jgi:hypothetical protein
MYYKRVIDDKLSRVVYSLPTQGIDRGAKAKM